ncbi:RNA polymerase sigma-70 factor [Jejuia spongiicola]|uniref:RNA polymerase sigma-70 factor n=1 Tax=Jejuia spongiicola TaxID=2942207 RepID=A0ABT0QJ78_9FLAO|nr:RNA polymerase sigma-70 factor [Jejuia spongiicola]MCL6296703.1 RNA polymerase sigma-70 factor [Jejuia spongiicola]
MKNSKLNITSSLVSLLKNGDRNAYKTIFDAYYKRLYVFALKYVEDSYMAEEIVENVLFILWQKRHKMGDIDNLKSYLYAMVRNTSLDYLKNQKKFERYDKEKHDSIHFMEQFIIEEETHAILFQALESLPSKCRKVFELSCIEGVKYADIAEDLQISLNTVKSQRARAIELLRIHLKNYPLFQILLASL